ncbi:MAG: phosphate/phosphite/phosphonate ABC transporter substrate-binding protein [Deltaproteobacteria bacterium]|jgi:phosphonate transport system substrate-binding protein|nr:phosphate/phosphite/phosphonate ABC transporter substrate-binding protein [Deltaproteobacteria bacterium]MBT4067467.1 phosphate/phosphite/phosphonate ABC transporter substrate-binding protein [Candidatus Neomarinimicrobiota bacterium]MBT5176835.1 phosphate/phosphite/phosphonate ABC transporter substrate-binding protein [Candidatus Neomarinimicrobiota bacterium]
MAKVVVKNKKCCRFSILVFLLFLNLVFSGQLLGGESAVRFGLTPVILDNQRDFLERWQKFLEKHLERPVIFFQRRTYGEITEMLLQEQLDIAWVCGRPYVQHQQKLQLLAVPLYRGKPLYQSYLIALSDNTGIDSILDLKGKVFAYSDPDSNSGHLVPNVMLRREGKDPKTFFAKTFFTWSHRDVVSAVASGLAQGGAVDGYVWETLNLVHPELTQRTRILNRSQEFGFPPLVARPSLPKNELLLIQSALLQMNKDPNGIQLLQKLNLDGFVEGDDALFDGIRESLLFVTGY